MRKSLDDLDQLHHRLAHMRVGIEVEPVRLRHQRAGADQQVAEPRPRADAGMAVMRGIGLRQEAGLAPLAGQEHVGVRHEHAIEDHDPR